MRKKRRKEQAEERKRLREEKIRQSEDKKKEREAKKKEDAAAKEKRMQDKLKQVQDKKKKREVMSMRMKQLQHHRDKRRARIDRQAEDRRKKCQICHTGAERGIELVDAVHAVADITLIACAGERSLLQRAKSGFALPVLLFYKFFSVIKPKTHN